MNSLIFAVASIVDTTTGQQLSTVDRERFNRDYGSAASHGRKIRSQTMARLIDKMKSNLANISEKFQQYNRRQKEVKQLSALNQHLLQDIGLNKKDIYLISRGKMTLESIQTQKSQADLLTPVSAKPANFKDLGFEAANEAEEVKAHCA